MIVDAPPSPDVVVTAPRLPDAAGDAAFSTVVVDAVAFRDAPGLDAALKSVAGFSLLRRTSTLGANPTTQGASLRAIAGSGASRALITLDGVPQNDPFGGWVIWTALPPEAIGGAQVVRGAGAGPYGAGALTGVVSLDSRGDLNGAEVDASVGSLGNRQALLTAGGAVGGARVLVDVAGQNADGWIPVIEGRGRADRPLSLSALSAAARVEGRAGEVAVAARLAAYDESRGAGQVSAASRAKGVQASLAAAVRPTPDTLGWRLQGWISGSDLYNASASLAAGRNASTPANVQYATPALGWGFNAALRRLSGGTSVELGADVRGATGESRERFTFAAGDFTKGRKAGGQTLAAGLYVEASTLRNGWLFTGGVRADQWSESHGERVEKTIASGFVTLNNRPADSSGLLPTARFAARREIGGGWAWRTAAYAGFRPATLNELHRPFRVGNNLTESNPALNPERLYGVEAGLDVHAGALTGAATLFRNRLENAILNVTLGVGPGTFPIAGFVPAGGVLRQRQNAGAVGATGLEGEADWRLAKGIVLTGALAWTASKVDGGGRAPQLDGKRPALTPRFTGVAGVNWQATPTLDLRLNASYESARFDDDLNTLRLRAGLTADLRADWRVRPGLGLFLAIDNLADAKTQTAQTADGIYSYDAPRIVRVGIRFAT